MKHHIFPPLFIIFKLSPIRLWLPLVLFWPIYFSILLLAYIIAFFWMLYRMRIAPLRVVTLFHVIICSTQGLVFELPLGKKMISFKLF